MGAGAAGARASAAVRSVRRVQPRRQGVPSAASEESGDSADVAGGGASSRRVQGAGAREAQVTRHDPAGRLEGGDDDGPADAEDARLAGRRFGRVPRVIGAQPSVRVLWQAAFGRFVREVVLCDRAMDHVAQLVPSAFPPYRARRVFGWLHRRLQRVRKKIFFFLKKRCV